MAVSVRMPLGSNRNVEPGDVLIMRNALDHERNDNPDVRTTIILSSGRLYTADDLDNLQAKFETSIKLAELTVPNETKVFVSMSAVLNVDPPGPQDDPSTRAVLRFGATTGAERQAVRETNEQLKKIWETAGVPWAGP